MAWFVLMLAMLCAASTAKDAKQPPNIIFILADDLVSLFYLSLFYISALTLLLLATAVGLYFGVKVLSFLMTFVSVNFLASTCTPRLHYLDTISRDARLFL